MRLLTPPPPRNVRALKGIVSFTNRNGVWYAKKWPRPRGKKHSRHQLRAIEDFSFIATRSKIVTPQEYAAAVKAAKGTVYTWRDLIERAMTGMFSVITLTDGRVLIGVRNVAPDAQLVLDQVGTETGAIVIRLAGDAGWVALLPGEAGQVLSIPDASSIPEWADPAGAIASVFGRAGDVVAADGDYSASLVTYDPDASGLASDDVQGAVDELAVLIAAVAAGIPADLQTALDALGATQGTIIYRGDSGWVALAPGTSGQYLVTQAAGHDPLWQDLGVPPSTPLFNPPLAANFATLRNSPTIADVANVGMTFTGAAGSTTIRAGYQALGADKTYTARVTFTGLADNTAAGFMMRDSSGGKCLSFGPAHIGSLVKIHATQWNNDASASSDALTPTGISADPCWLRVIWHATAKTFDLEFSMDGQKWLRLLTANAWVTTPNQIGFGVWSTTTGGPGAGVSAGLCDYYTAA